jgi:hypothetical protein
VFRWISDDAAAALAEELAQPMGPSPTASPRMALTLRRLRRLAPTAEEICVAGGDLHPQHP